MSDKLVLKGDDEDTNSGSSGGQDSDSGSSGKGKAVISSSDEPITVSRTMSRVVRETLNASNPDKGNATSSSNITSHFIPGSSDACAVGNSLPRDPSNPFRLIATQESSSNASSSRPPVTANFNLNNPASSFIPQNWTTFQPSSSYSYPAIQERVNVFASPNPMIYSNTYIYLPYSLLMQINRPYTFTGDFRSSFPVFSESLHPRYSLFWGYTRIYLTGPTSAFTFVIDLAGVQYSLQLQLYPSSPYLVYVPWGSEFNLNNMAFYQSYWPQYSTWGSEMTVQYEVDRQPSTNQNLNEDQPNLGPDNDEFHDMRLDIDNWTYEELLALEDRIGTIGTGLTEEEMSSMRTYTTCHTGEVFESCSICQEAYTVGDEIGIVDCDHEFHKSCIQTWLARKNRCPVCKRTALPPTNPSE